VGKECEVTSSDMNDETFSVTMMLSLNPEDTLPFSFDLRKESNSQWDFLQFICDLIELGKLVAGDFLIVYVRQLEERRVQRENIIILILFLRDNASVHTGSDAFPQLMALLDAAGVRLVFLPKYSPELNPCEEVFGLVKHHLRFWRGFDRFWLEIITAFLKVNYLQVFKYYENAILFK
jgi:transposase